MEGPCQHLASLIVVGVLAVPVTSAAGAPIVAVPPLSQWISIAPFKTGSKEMSCANRHVGGEWTISSEGAQLQVHRFEHPPDPPLRFALPRGSPFERPSSSLEVSDGVLVGFDGGEWGGGLSWFARDGSTNHRVVDSNVLAVVASERGAVAIGGLAHLGPSAGQVFELERDGGRWKVAHTLDVGAAPAVAAADPRGGLLVVTTAGLSRYGAGSIRQVHASDYTVLFPNSLVAMPDGTILIGMRHAIARLTPNGAGYQETWLVRPDCAALSITEDPVLTCNCRPKR